VVKNDSSAIRNRRFWVSDEEKFIISPTSDERGIGVWSINQSNSLIREFHVPILTEEVNTRWVKVTPNSISVFQSHSTSSTSYA
jgi:hypothetical protein